MHKRTRRGLTGLAAAVAVTLTLGGCGLLGGGAGDGAAAGGAASESGQASGAPTTLPADQAAKEIMATTEDNAKPLASANGSLDVTGAKVAVTAEVLDVHAYPDTTQVAWRLKSTNGNRVDTASSQLSFVPRFDTRQLALVDPATSTTYRPFTYVPEDSGDGRDLDCECSDLPENTDGNGTVLYAELPPLPDSVTSVSVTLPGFTAMTGVRVSR